MLTKPLLARSSRIHCTQSLNLDPFLMGVGGDDSWTQCVHDGFLLPPDEIYEFDVSMTFD